jgi:xanthine/CO dehydrogenase XdhC/CoxF family maturation factor
MWEMCFEQASRWRVAGEPFALATVVACQRPTAAYPGAKALIRADGALTGWVGGSCAQPTVIQEALKSLADGKARLLTALHTTLRPARVKCALFPLHILQAGIAAYLRSHTRDRSQGCLRQHVGAALMRLKRTRTREAMQCTPARALCYDIAYHVESMCEEI